MSNRMNILKFLCLVLIGMVGMVGCSDTSSYDVIIANGTYWELCGE